MTGYYNPSRRLSDWAAAALSPFIQLETQEGQSSQSSSLSVALWSGQVQLKNVELRPEAFDQYLNPSEPEFNEFGTRIRWKIVRGTIDDVSVSIPWKRLLVGTSYSSSRKRGRQHKQEVALVEGQNAVNRSLIRLDSDAGPSTAEIGSCVDQEGEQAPNHPAEDDKNTLGCTVMKIDGVNLIIGYEVIHQSLDPTQSQSFNANDSAAEEQSQKRVSEEKNRILQIAERRLLAGLDPFPPALTESLQKDIQSILQSSLEQSLSVSLPNENSENTSTSTYISNYFSTTIKSLLWRTYDSLSVSVSRVRMSIVGDSHYDKKVRILSKKRRIRKRPEQKPDERGNNAKRPIRSSSHAHGTSFDSAFKERHRRFINADFWDHNWEQYPATITPIRRGGTSKLRQSSGSTLDECSDEDDSDDCYKDEDKPEAAAVAEDEDDATVWSKEGHVELGLVLDKLDIRPGLQSQTLPPKQGIDGNKEICDAKDQGPMSVKHLHFRSIGAFVRRAPLSSLIAKSKSEPKQQRKGLNEKRFWHGLDLDEFIIIPTSIETECKFYRHANGGDTATISSLPTAKDKSTDNNSKQRQSKPGVSHDRTDRSHATTETKRRDKRDKIRLKPVEQSTKSTMETIESNFTESCLIPKQLELNWKVGHVRSSVSSRNMYLICSAFKSLMRLKQGRPSVTIRSAKTSDRKLIEQMAEEGKPMMTALDARMYRILPQLRSPTKYCQLLSLQGVVLAWWKYAITSVILELNQRNNLINKCTSTSERKRSSNLTAVQKLQWDWNHQSKIRREYIQLYLLVNETRHVDEIDTKQSTTNRAALLAAESRLEELENGLSVERIMLLRNISRAALLSANATNAGYASSFYNFTTSSRLAEDLSFVVDGIDQQAHKGNFATETDIQTFNHDNADGRQGTNKFTAVEEKANGDLKDTVGDPMLCCSSVAFAGFSLALCELYHKESSKSDVKEDLSDDISALTGFSDSADTSSLYQLSEQYTIYERFDPTYHFWEHDKRKLRHEPISLLHISDITASLQHSNLKRKCKVLIGGVSICNGTHPANAIISVGHISGLEMPSKESSPKTTYMSILTVWDGSSPTTAYSSIKSLSVNVDWKLFQQITTFWTLNRESDRRNHLMPLYKESSLRKVTFDKKPTTQMSLSLECERIRVRIPILAVSTDKVSSVAVLSLVALRLGIGEAREDAERAPDDSRGYEVAIDEFNVQVIHQPGSLLSFSDVNTTQELFQIPLTIRVHSADIASNQPVIISISPVRLLISEDRIVTVMQLVQQYLRLCSSEKVQYIRLELPAISEYTVAEVQLSIESIGLHLCTKDNESEVSKCSSSEHHLREITTNYLTLISCLDIEYPNQDVMNCIERLYKDQCIALGLSHEDAQKCFDTAQSSYQDNIRSLDVESCTSSDTEQVIATAAVKILSVLGGTPKLPEAGLFIHTDAVSISWSAFYCKSMLQIKAKSLKCHDGTGTNLIEIASGDVPLSPTEDSFALIASLSSNEVTTTHVRREVYFELDGALVTFRPESFSNALAVLQTLADLSSINPEKADKTLTNVNGPTFSAPNLTVNGTLSSISILITDDFIPFATFNASGLSLNHSSASGEYPHTSLLADEIMLQCVSPASAETYPDVVTTHLFEECCTERSALAIHITNEKGISSDIVDVSIFLDGVRVTILRQFVNEVVQYISSSKYGLGLMRKSKEQHQTNTEKVDHPSNSRHMTINLTHSTIILPRDSNSIDLVGIELDALSICPTFVKDSWTLDSYSFHENTKSPPKMGSSEVFFDCIEDQMASSVSSGPQISRIDLHLRGARLYTALNAMQHSSNDVNLALWNSFVHCSGRCATNKFVYTRNTSLNDDTINAQISSEIKSRTWQEVTLEPLNIEVKADSTPHLRLMIEMMGSSLLDMRMSQLYLLMSIWFSNMQQLPVLFPYDEKFVEDSSMPPNPPPNWPEYGTDEFIERLKEITSNETFELALCIKKLVLKCSYDLPGYFFKDPATQSMIGEDTISLCLECAICSVISSDVLRVGIGATDMALLDGRTTKAYKQNASIKNVNGVLPLVDVNWGLDCGCHTLIDGLHLPFQVTVFMTPDNHVMINLGGDSLDGTLQDLSIIWILLDYFGLYFNDPAYGHPCFISDQIVRQVLGCGDIEYSSLDIDFRLWLTNPHLIIPSSAENHDGLCIMLEATSGIYYRFKSHGVSYSSQDVVAKDLAIVALRECIESPISRGRRQVSGCLKSTGAQTLIDGLSFSVQYDYNESANYNKLAVCIPLSAEHLDRTNMDGMETKNIGAQPLLCQPPLVCKPFFLPSRDMKTKFTAYLTMEYMKLALEVLTAFVGPKVEDNPEPHPPAQRNIYCITANVNGASFILSDPVMGMHRPHLCISLPSLIISVSQLQANEQNLSRRKSLCSLEAQSNCDSDLQASMETTIFIDYFKIGKTRNWEPLIEPSKCLVLYEQSQERGQGVTINMDCPLHLNITSAAIDTFDDAKNTFEKFCSSTADISYPRQSVSDLDTIIEGPLSHGITLIHSRAKSIDEGERRAFAMRNNTGQQIRVHTLSSLEKNIACCKTTRTVFYLDHEETMPLSFPATITTIRNLEPIEVMVEDHNDQVQNQLSKNYRHHLVDIQIPGFQWLHSVSIEDEGRKFIDLIPRSLAVQSKVDADWRLRNGLQLLAHVQSLHGGRRLSLRSPFEVVNKTDHPILLSLSPDPRHAPQSNENAESASETHNFELEELHPDDSFTVPHTLLEKALQIHGSHLGSFWIKPKPADNISQRDFLGYTTSNNNTCVEYPKRPIQLAKIVHETAVIWRESKADPMVANQFASGTEISCPILDSHGNPQTTPYCYVVEVKRSPLAPQKVEENLDMAQRELFSPIERLKSSKYKPIKGTDDLFQHQPVHYSLVIHPPIVIENLLPERGRFELMHATSRIVLWWGIIEPGQKVPVHTVGLDVPILLLVNLGFCRTPVGEGALVHHGRISEGLFKAGWNSLGHVMRSSKDKVKKTLKSNLFTVTESIDHRGAGRVSAVKRGLKSPNDTNATRKIGQLGLSNENEINENAIRYGESFDAEAIDSETVVIDSIGQRLTLHLDNVIGGGGQRFISLFCPYWIVNTTNHSLRYKQEKVAGYTSGTVLSPELDGSKRVDGSNRADEEKYTDDLLRLNHSQGPYSTIFSGRPGALHKQDGQIEPVVLASLLSENLPLSIMSSLAFMFNFEDVLSLGSPPRLCVQLADVSNKSYTSAWSSGFGLESVGVTQIVGMHCKDGRRLEVSISVTIAPGRLANYTKIVRICPRYVVVNQMSQPIRLWQDNSMLHPNQPIEHSSKVNESERWILSNPSSTETRFNEYQALFGEQIVIDVDNSFPDTSAHHDACYIGTVKPSALVAFHLPDTRIDRMLRIDIGSAWNLSSSFLADVTGSHYLTVTRSVDLRLLPHVSTRAAPVYTVTIPSPDKPWTGELGAYFETDWGRERTLIVKGVKDGSFASNWTDITVGDELISIDGIAVEEFTFDEAIKYMKDRFSSTKDKTESMHQFFRKTKTPNDQTLEPNDRIEMTFMTLEERMRNLRRKAVIGRTKTNLRNSIIKNSHFSKNEKLENSANQTKDLLIDMKFLFQSIFIFVHEPKAKDPPHMIRNRSLQWAIYYRQRNCEGHPWLMLYPGESAPYTWQEPTKPKKLSVRVGTCEGIFASTNKKEQKGLKVPFFSLHFINNEEEGHYGATKTIKLEEIGHVDVLPCPENRNKEQTEKVYCTVDTEGLTRALIISDEIMGSYKDDETLIKCHLANIRQEIASEDKKMTQLEVFDSILSDAEDTSTPNDDSHNYIRQNMPLMESELRELIDYAEGQYIDKRHQVLVQVLEATGLVSANLNGLSNPYAKVSLRHRTSAFKSATQSRSTYFIEKSLSPTWSEQIFVFDVPEKAADDPRETRNLSLQCIIKSREKLGKDSFLGQVQIQLRDLINQRESIGWYPLMNILGQRDVDSVDRIRGSVKIRLHYVIDYRGLVSYYKLCSQRRIDALKKTKSGMQRQLRALRETAQQQAGVKESVSLESVPALTTIVKRKGAKSRLTEVKDHEKLNQSSRIIQGVRDGTENLKKSIGLAKSVVQRGKRRNSSRSSIGSAVDKDWSLSKSSVLLDSPLKEEDETVTDGYASVKANPVNLLVQESSSSDDEDGVIKANPRPMNFVLKSAFYSSRVASLRGHCTDHQAVYSSWITSRAYVRAVNAADHLHSKKKSDSNKSDLSDFLQLPPSAPSFVKNRERKYTESLIKSRLLFSKKAKRSLSSVVNPGGVLTIRPITALNLADDYAGMFLKLRYGTTILISETVDCKVAPVWTEDENNLSAYRYANTPKKKQRKSMLIKRKASDAGPSELADLTEIINPLARWGRPRKNDLQIEVAPFETSKSLRLSVIGERMSQSNVEIGILDIELGPAIECCTQSLEEFEEKLARGIHEVPPAYVRWFPLTYPTDALPIEGDMGQSVKPKESEKPRDDMFREYFAPCIKLALMFKPYSDDIDEDNQKSSDDRSQNSSANKLSTNNQYLYAKLDCLSAALIDSNRTSIGELISFTSRCADFRLSVTKAKTRVSFAVGHVQVDQQRMTQDSRAPVILAPSPCKHPQPVIQLLIWKDNIQSKPDLDSFEYVAIEVQNLDLKIDESLLFDIWAFYVAVAKSRERKEEHTKQTIQQTPPQFSSGGGEETEDIQAFARDFLKKGPGAVATSKKVYIRELILGFMKISLSYYKRRNAVLEDDLNTARYELFLSPKVLSQRMSDRNTSDEAFKQWSENNTDFAAESDDSPSPSTINIVSAIIPSISDASISFQGKLISHVFEGQADIWKSLRSHYSSEALKQIYKIVGSLDFVGNPSMLLTSFRTGLRDFILQPSRELKHITRNPSRLGVGVLKGTVSLFSNSTSGIFGFFSNIGFTASRTSTKFTFDEHFQRHHSQKETAQHRHYDRWKRKGCGHVTLMVTRPVHDIVFGVISATTGVITEPYRGAKSNGVVGFSKGVGVGMLGLVVKPMVGLCDAFAHVMGSFDDIAKSVNLIDVKFKPIERYRLPYTFGASKMLMPFNQVPSKSAQLLLAYPLDKKSRRIEEVIVTSQALHIGPGWDHFVVVTTKRIVFFKLKDIDGTGFITVSLDWQLRFEPETRITSSLVTKGHNRLALYVSKSTSIHDITQEEISLSSNEDITNFSRIETKEDHDSSYANLDRMYSLPETPKAFRLRNTRLFANTEAEGMQRFLIKGDFSQRKYLVQVHNAICCLSGNLDELISEGMYFTGNEGVTTFGNLSFGENETGTQIEDLKLLFSVLEHSPWMWTSGASGEAITNQAELFSSDQNRTLPALHIESANEQMDRFTFGSSSFDGSQKSYTNNTQPGFEPPSNEFLPISGAADNATSSALHIYNEHTSSNREINDQRETESPPHTPHAERSAGADALDLRLQRLEELLGQLVQNQLPNSSLDAVESTESVEQQGQEHTDRYFNERLSPINELSREHNISSNDTADIETLRNEISELRQANMQLQEQVNKAGQKTKVGIMKIFNFR